MGNLEFALWYCDRFGFAIIPIAAGTKKPPRGFAWKSYQTVRPTDAQLRKWFGNGRGHGLAVVLGEVSDGLLCRDFDDMAAYDHWAAEFPNLAKSLPTVETGRPGRHVYCRGDVGQIRAASGTGSGIIDFGNGELRGTGAFVVVPPSRHPGGHIYRWIIPPNGEIPFLDLHDCGFLKSVDETESNREYRENGGIQRPTETTEAIKGCSGEEKQLTTMASVGFQQPFDLRAAIEDAIFASLPSRPGRRNVCVFELARCLKAIPQLADVDPVDLRPVVKEWHRRALPFISTRPFEETWIDFLHGWPNVKYPKGTEPMNQILARAAATTFPKVAERYEQPQLRLLVSLCRELQRNAGNASFFLSARMAGKLLNVDHMRAWRWLFLLESDKVLRVEIRGIQGRSKATRFRYVAD